ncbi:uncharacterized protein [Halyomorpha halys]|uniref:uncharacterized protein n=1 Tax=Halyomorpha halys TaxID=286706 RepID=UPI000D0C8686|nr:uncharacterized protein LOC106691112 [Halyomorpha halys]
MRVQVAIVYSSLFQLSAPAGANDTNCDGEVAAITLALEKLTRACAKKIVLLSDSRAALLAIASRHPSTNARILACRKSIDCKREILKVLVMQWIPAHCGIPGSQPQSLLPITMDMAKEIVRSASPERAEERSREECGGTTWAALLDPKSRPRLTLPRAVSVACFRLATGHDYLRHHLKRIGVTESSDCVLCGAGEMTGDNLFACAETADLITDRSNFTQLT